MEKIISFLRDVKLEMSRVSWPTREQTVKYTVVVVIISLVVAGFLGGLDIVFQYILNRII